VHGRSFVVAPTPGVTDMTRRYVRIDIASRKFPTNGTPAG